MNMKVLIVEDDLIVRKYLALVIRSQGFEITEAADGQAGYEQFQEVKPDIVLTDILMPRMNGLQLLERIREKNFDTVVIMQSSMASPEYTLQALRLKANDYLVKPLVEKDLLAALDKYRKILSSRTRDREIVGMIFRRDLGMRIGNNLDEVGKIVDRLMMETEQGIPPKQRLGIHLGLLEVITNSIEHGNLGITYREKTEAMDGADHVWTDLFTHRQKTSPYNTRQVTIEFKMSLDTCEWLITDEGAGFDFPHLPDPTDPENILAAHGRGILLSRMQFNVFEYLGSGNCVRLVKNRQLS